MSTSRMPSNSNFPLSAAAASANQDAVLKIRLTIRESRLPIAVTSPYDVLVEREPLKGLNEEQEKEAEKEGERTYESLVRMIAHETDKKGADNQPYKDEYDYTGEDQEEERKMIESMLAELNEEERAHIEGVLSGKIKAPRIDEAALNKQRIINQPAQIKISEIKLNAKNDHIAKIKAQLRENIEKAKKAAGSRGALIEFVVPSRLSLRDFSDICEELSAEPFAVRAVHNTEDKFQIDIAFAHEKSGLGNIMIGRDEGLVLDAVYESIKDLLKNYTAERIAEETGGATLQDNEYFAIHSFQPAHKDNSEEHKDDSEEGNPFHCLCVIANFGEDLNFNRGAFVFGVTFSDDFTRMLRDTQIADADDPNAQANLSRQMNSQSGQGLVRLLSAPSVASARGITAPSPTPHVNGGAISLVPPVSLMLRAQSESAVSDLELDETKVAAQGLLDEYQNYQQTMPHGQGYPHLIITDTIEAIKQASLQCAEVANNNKDIVLIVDDVPANLKLVVMLVKGLLKERPNCQVVQATNGLIAFEIMRRYGDRAVVIFMDVKMPIIDGIQSMNLIRAKFGFSIPIMALTANDSDAEVKNAGFTGIHKKPYQRAVINATLQSMFLEKQNRINIAQTTSSPETASAASTAFTLPPAPAQLTPQSRQHHERTGSSRNSPVSIAKRLLEGSSKSGTPSGSRHNSPMASSRRHIADIAASTSTEAEQKTVQVATETEQERVSQLVGSTQQSSTTGGVEGMGLFGTATVRASTDAAASQGSSDSGPEPKEQRTSLSK
jgi:CheY-like chemotaxis protein